MAGRFEPFLINPPRRLVRRPRKRLKLRRRARRNPMIDDPKEIAAFEKQWKRTAGAHKRTKKVAKLASARGPKRRRRRVVRRKGISHRAAVLRARKAWRTRLAKKLRGRKATMARRRGKRRVARRTRRRVVTRHARMRSQFFRPKRRIKRKGYAKKRKKHMISAYMHRGHLYTSPFARRVWPNHRLNPFRRRFRRNPFGEEMMVMGANPRRRRRRRSYKSNPRRRRRYMARGRRRMSRNPLGSMAHLMPMVAAGTVGAIVTKMAPRLVGVTSPMAAYGTQAVVVLGGGFLADKFMGKAVSDGWVVGGASIIITNLLGGVLGGALAGLGLEYEAFPTEQLGTFPMGMLGDAGGYGAENEFDNVTAVY